MYYEEKPYAEIGEILSIPPGYVPLYKAGPAEIVREILPWGILFVVFGLSLVLVPSVSLWVRCAASMSGSTWFMYTVLRPRLVASVS